MLKRGIASINYRLNVKPFETVPAGSHAWISARQGRLRELESEALKLVSNASINPNTDYTGAGRIDYLLLCQYVLQKRPQNVLELGSGITTHYLTRAMQATGCGTLTTVDHIAHYSDATRDMLPGDLRPHVKFVVTPAIGAMWGGVSG
jgi:hypothetical protein